MNASNLPFSLVNVEATDAADDFPVNDLFRTRRTPLLLKGFAARWPAVRRWTMAHLRRHFAGRDLGVSWSADRIFPGKRGGAIPQARDAVQTTIEYRNLPAETIFDSLDDPAGQYYLNALPLHKEPALCDDIPIKPAHSPDFQGLLWISNVGHTTPLHFDGNDVLFAQIHGQKQFVLFPPEAFDRLYTYSVDHPQARYSQLLDLTSPDFDRFPRAKGLTGLTARLEPGDVLFVPNHWWHAVFTGSPSASASFLLNKNPTPKFEELMGYWEALHQLIDASLPADLPPIMRVYAMRLMLFPASFSGPTDGPP